MLALPFIANSERLELVTGLPKPPFVINKQQGIQIELVKAAFANQNLDVSYSLMPLGRNVSSFLRWDFDGIITLPVEFKHPNIFSSKPYVSYQNVAVTLTNNNYELENIQQLLGRSIVAFQGAKKFLGDEYGDITAYSTNYREVANQRQQIAMLFSGRVDVIVLERHIFQHLLNQQQGAIYQKPYRLHYIFPEKHYVAGFNSAKLAEQFNQGIQTLKDQGYYQQIIEKYLL